MTSDRRYFLCSCYFTDNIFLQNYELHVTYHTNKQFLDSYREILKIRGCESEDQWEKLLNDVTAEVEKRKNSGKEHVERCEIVIKSYKRRHPMIYTLSENYFEPEFLKAVVYAKSDRATPDGLMEVLHEEDAPNVYSLSVFTLDFCAKLMEEVRNFEKSDIPKGRPNTMNKGGVLLSEMGFDEKFMDVFRENYLIPLARLLYPDWVDEGLDSHRAFIVKYTMEEDVKLSYHFDNAEVTLNVCLGPDFTGGDLYFGTMRTERAIVSHEQRYIFKHTVGRGLLHRAQHMHGAHPITSGERYNLIIWMRSSSIRNELCPMCNKTPVLVPNLGFGDGFTCENTSQCKLI